LGYIPDLKEDAANCAKRIEKLDGARRAACGADRLLQTERYAPKIDRIFDEADQGARRPIPLVAQHKMTEGVGVPVFLPR
jgi:hypothetical protein